MREVTVRRVAVVGALLAVGGELGLNAWSGTTYYFRFAVVILIALAIVLAVTSRPRR